MKTQSRRTRRIYIAGPMRGYPLLNCYEFSKAFQGLTAKSWDAINPITLHEEITKRYNDTGTISHKDHLKIARENMETITHCNAIYMLTGWETSIGARAEHALAVWIGLNILYQ